LNPTVSRVRVALALGIVALVVLLFYRNREDGKAAEEKTREAIRKVLDDQVEAWNQGRLEGFMDGYWKSDDLTFFSDDKVQHGWQATYDRYRAKYQADGKEMGTLRFDELQIDPTGPRSAAVRGRWQLTFKDGRTPGGLFTLLFRKEGQDWRIVHDHTSAKPPPEAPLPAPGG
jgi:beta-aspartyl-peptidase (threonine type)